MGTTEHTASELARQVYDGFISYSHAADDLLAPRLQAGLQRFAKPWWKRRALRVFRDESSLSANPHLWSSITEALDSSGWFVLLLSPDAAQSEWVNNEIGYWVEHKDPSKILPVLTDGEFGWADGDITGDAVPDALRGVFEDEPRWVDLRFAKGEEQLDLQDPRFADAIADVASAMRGVPKDELAGEEVRQHRRTVRTAWAAGAMLLVLAVAAGWAGILSAQNAAEARANAEEASRQAALAEEAAATSQAEAARADANAEEATAERNNALEAAALARAQALAATSGALIDADPELASLLAVLSARTAPGEIPAESLAALRRADAADLLVYRIPVEPSPADEPLLVRTAPNGGSFVSGNALRITHHDITTGEELWSVDDLGLGLLLSMAVSPTGEFVVATGPGVGFDDPGHVKVFSMADGSLVHELVQACPFAGWFLGDQPFTPDGAVLGLGTGDRDCDETGWVSFLDTETWEEVDRLRVETMAGQGVSFSADGTVMAITDEFRAEVRSYPDLEVLTEFEMEGCCLNFALSPAGDRVAHAGTGRVGVYDVADGELLGAAEGAGLVLPGMGTIFSPDGQELLVTSRDGVVLVETEEGRLVQRVGGLEPVFAGSFTPDGSGLVTVDPEGIAVWRLGAGPPLRTADDVVSYLDADAMVEGPVPAALAVLGPLRPGAPTGLLLIDESSGAVETSIHAGGAVQLPDGRFVIAGTDPRGTVPDDEFVYPRMVGQDDRVVTGLDIWDPLDGSRTPLSTCDVLISQTERFAPVPQADCGDGRPVFAVHNRRQISLAASPDGTKVAATSDRQADRPLPDVAFCGDPGLGLRETRVWDSATGAVIAQVKHDECWDLLAMGDDYLVLADLLDVGGVVLDFSGAELARIEATELPTVELSGDGRHLFIGGNRFGTMAAYDTRDWTLVALWDADEVLIRGIALSPDGTRLVTTSEGRVRVWDVSRLAAEDRSVGERPPLLDEIPLIASDARWIDQGTLGLALEEGQWAVVNLDADRVVEEVTQRLRRSFTAEQCADYGIDPCPSLEDLRDG